ncbi:GNAT family N-acetyltransferase, partial [Candidatus Bipolaricaulota bacterium]|nr:GNAT family N-acetyltransferase [Candidatus Bipolaricaulota bacterium]
IGVRPYAPGADLRPTVKMVRNAFRDHWGYVDAPFEEELKQWEHWTTAYKDFDPSLWFVAIDESNGEIVGAALGWPKNTEDPEMGWIDVLGVVRRWRKRGLAQALLHHAFGEFFRRGNRKVGLGVDASSLTGATRLYERAGMRPVRRTFSYEKELRAGRELSRRTLDDS